MCQRKISKILAIGLIASLYATDIVQANDDTSGKTSFSFCYQDIELYPNYTGDSAKVPDKDPGVLVELVQYAAQEANLKPEFLRYPWKRCLSLIKLGRIDSVIASFRPERQEALVYPMQDGKPDVSRFITMNGYYLYQKKDQPTLWDGNSFLNPSILVGAPLGYSITAALKEEGLNIVEAGTTEGLLQMLLYDRLQAVAGPGAAADTILRQHADEYASVIKVDAPLRVNHYFLTFSHQFHKNHPEAARDLWMASPKVHEAHFSALQTKYALPAGAD